ncbi:MAG TPA: aminotransferase class V-fold PLP-dependent enzyme, partial [Chitinophagaceae bacterium]
VHVNGDRVHRLPNVLNICFAYADNESLVTRLSNNVAVSLGSACMSAVQEPSYVLKALGLDDELAGSSLRFSLGRFTTEEEIDYTIEQVTNAVHKLKETSYKL